MVSDPFDGLPWPAAPDVSNGDPADEITLDNALRALATRTDTLRAAVGGMEGLPSGVGFLRRRAGGLSFFPLTTAGTGTSVQPTTYSFTPPLPQQE